MFGRVINTLLVLIQSTEAVTGTYSAKKFVWRVSKISTESTSYGVFSICKFSKKECIPGAFFNFYDIFQNTCKARLTTTSEGTYFNIAFSRTTIIFSGKTKYRLYAKKYFLSNLNWISKNIQLDNIT